jgi:hypothetical protein
MTGEPTPSTTTRRVVRQRAGMTDDGETRGRPADAPAAMSRDELATATNDANFQDNPELLTRRKLGDGATDMFTIPEHLKKPGWDYEYKARFVMGQPVDDHMPALERDQGWRPAPAKDFQEILAPEYSKPVVERGGMLLMMRPRRLSVQAKNEMLENADRQRQEKLKQALAGPQDQDRRMPFGPVKGYENIIEGEVGSYRPREG